MSLGFWKRKKTLCLSFLSFRIICLGVLYTHRHKTPPSSNHVDDDDDFDDEVPEWQNGVLFGKKIHHHQQQHQEQQHLCVLEECWQRPKLRDDETKIILDFGVIIVVIVARGVFFLSSKNGSDDGRVRRGELRRFRSRARPGV